MTLLRNFLKNSAVQLFHKNKFLFNHGILRTSSSNLQVSQDSNINQNSYRYQMKINNLRQKISSHDFVKLTDIKMILSAVKEKESMTSSEALFLLRNCGDIISFEEFNKRITLTNEIWNLIKQFDVVLDITHFNSLLQAYIENGSEVDSSEILEMMKNKNIKPNRITYSKLIQQRCQHGDIEGANKLMQIMSEENHSIDESIFNSLIIGNSRANDMDGAMEVINNMKEKGMLIESKTYECLMKVHSENNNFEKFEETLAEAKKEDISISSKTLFDSYVKFILHKNIDASNKIHSMLPSNQPVKFIAPHLLKLAKAEEYGIASDLISFSKTPDVLQNQYINSMQNFDFASELKQHYVRFEPASLKFKSLPMIQLIKEFNNYYDDGFYKKAEDTYKSMGSATIVMKLRLITMYYNQHRYDDLLNVVASINIRNFILPTDLVTKHIIALMSLGRINDAIEKIKSVDKLVYTKDLLVAIENIPHDDSITLKNVIMKQINAPKAKMNIIHNIKSNNLELALENIQNECESTGKLCFKQEFYMQCIQNEQPEILQKFYDYHIEKRGKTSASNFLAISFLKMKKVKQAKHLFQTIGLNKYYYFYDRIHEHFRNANDTEGLQNILKVMIDIPSDCRIHLYEGTIKHFIDNNDSEKALEFWTNMQDENLQLTDEFSVKFAKILTDKGEDVPFAVPQDISDKPTNNKKPSSEVFRHQRSNELINALRASHRIDKYEEFVEVNEKNQMILMNSSIYLTEIMNSTNVTNCLKFFSTRNLMIPKRVLRKAYNIFKEENRINEYFQATSDLKEFSSLHLKYIFDYLLSSPDNLEIVTGENFSINCCVNIALWNYYLAEGRHNDAVLISEKLSVKNYIMMDVFEKVYSKGQLDILKNYISNIKNPEFRSRNLYFYNLWKSKHLCEEGKSNEALQNLNDIREEIGFQNFQQLRNDVTRLIKQYNV